MASPNEIRANNTCQHCGDRISRPYTRVNHPNKEIVRHLTNRDCQASKGKFRAV